MTDETTNSDTSMSELFDKFRYKDFRSKNILILILLNNIIYTMMKYSIKKLIKHEFTIDKLIVTMKKSKFFYNRFSKTKRKFAHVIKPKIVIILHMKTEKGIRRSHIDMFPSIHYYVNIKNNETRIEFLKFTVLYNYNFQWSSFDLVIDNFTKVDYINYKNFNKDNTYEIEKMINFFKKSIDLKYRFKENKQKLYLKKCLVPLINEMNSSTIFNIERGDDPKRLPYI